MEQHTSIQELPLEILVSVFRLSFHITTLQKDRTRLILVCRYWKDIVQNSANLWTEISGHDSISYVQTSLVKSANLPIDIHYLPGGPQRALTYLPDFLNVVCKHLSRCRLISFITGYHILPHFDEFFIGLRTIPPPRLESLALKASRSYRPDCLPDYVLFSSPQLPGMTAFPKLRWLEIDGFPCKLSFPGLQLNNVRSLNLIDVINVESEQLLEVLRSSPCLERLVLGRSPLAYPSQPAVAPIHLPHLMALHLLFMPIQVSNFLLTTIHAPNCSELFISSGFPELPEDVVRESLFTSNTEHFSPILQKLLIQGQYNIINVRPLNRQIMVFTLKSHNEEVGYPVDRGFVWLEFELHSVEQIEATAYWLVGCLNRDMPKIPIRFVVNGIDDVRVLNPIDSNMAVTHFGFVVDDEPGATHPSPILVHMAQPALSSWPLPHLEVFVYNAADGSVSQDEVMLDMLRRRYGSSSKEPDSAGLLPRPLRRMRIRPYETQDPYLLGEVEKILPQAKTSLVENCEELFWY